MSARYTTALCDLMATLENCVRFAAYHKAHQTPAAASFAMRTMTIRLDEMRALGNGIIADFEAKKHRFDNKSRKAWEDEQAAKIVAMFEKLTSPLQRLASEERLSLGFDSAKFQVGHGLHAVNARTLQRCVTECIEAEQHGGDRNPGQNPSSPFSGLNFGLTFKAPAAIAISA